MKNRKEYFLFILTGVRNCADYVEKHYTGKTEIHFGDVIDSALDELYNKAAISNDNELFDMYENYREEAADLIYWALDIEPIDPNDIANAQAITKTWKNLFKD